MRCLCSDVDVSVVCPADDTHHCLVYSHWSGSAPFHYAHRRAHEPRLPLYAGHNRKWKRIGEESSTAREQTKVDFSGKRVKSRSVSQVDLQNAQLVFVACFFFLFDWFF